MLKIQELNIDDVKFRLREPRLIDLRNAQAAPDNDFVLVMLSGMLLDENDKEVGREAVDQLPLRIFDRLAATVNQLLMPKTSGPLDGTNGSSTGSPSPSEGQPSLNLSGGSA